MCTLYDIVVGERLHTTRRCALGASAARARTRLVSVQPAHNSQLLIITRIFSVLEFLTCHTLNHLLPNVLFVTKLNKYSFWIYVL